MIARATTAVAGLRQRTERRQQTLDDHDDARSIATAAGEASKNRTFSDADRHAQEELR